MLEVEQSEHRRCTVASKASSRTCVYQLPHPEAPPPDLAAIVGFFLTRVLLPWRLRVADLRDGGHGTAVSHSRPAETQEGRRFFCRCVFIFESEDDLKPFLCSPPFVFAFDYSYLYFAIPPPPPPTVCAEAGWKRVRERHIEEGVLDVRVLLGAAMPSSVTGSSGYSDYGSFEDNLSDEDDVQRQELSRIAASVAESQVRRAAAAAAARHTSVPEQAGEFPGSVPSSVHRTVQDALDFNLELQRALRLQLDSVERSLALSNRARRAAAEASMPSSALTDMDLCVPDASILRKLRVRPSVVADGGEVETECPSGRPPPSTDELRRRALSNAVPVRPAPGRASQPWDNADREALREGVVACIMSEANRDLLQSLGGGVGGSVGDGDCGSSGRQAPSLSPWRRRELEGQLRWLHSQSRALQTARASDAQIRTLLR